MYYEKIYHTTVHNHLSSNDNYYNTRARLALIKYFSDVSKDLKILDFGCGLGQNIYLFSNATGYDISKFSLDFCKKKEIKVVNNLESVEDNFDVIFSSHVLEHTENPFETIKFMRSKLNNNGKLILILPVEKHKKSDFRLDKHQHLYCWNFKSINNLLIKNNFEIIENKYLRGDGYKKLLFFAFNFKFYRLLTWLTGLLCGTKEMKIVAIKR